MYHGGARYGNRVYEPLSLPSSVKIITLMSIVSSTKLSKGVKNDCPLHRMSRDRGLTFCTENY